MQMIMVNEYFKDAERVQQSVLFLIFITFFDTLCLAL